MRLLLGEASRQETLTNLSAMTPDTHNDLFRLLESIALSLREIADAAKTAKAPAPPASTPKSAAKPPTHTGDTSAWRSYAIGFGKAAGQTLGDLADRDRLQWWIDNFTPKLRNDGTPWPDSAELRAMLDAAAAELGGQSPAPVAPKPAPVADDFGDVPF
jgi:hypothetical protein